MRYIDADALMKKLEREVELADDWKTAHEIVNVVKYFPTAEPEPKHAHWVEEGDKIWCSRCGDIQEGYYSVYADISDEYKEKRALSRPRYCRGCGSLMDGEIERREQDDE